jgi:hypothetical protein
MDEDPRVVGSELAKAVSRLTNHAFRNRNAGESMTVDDLVVEGHAFLLAHPSAPERRVRAYLDGLEAGEHENMCQNLAAGGPDGCLVALVIMPVMAVVRLIRQRIHRKRVKKAMRELFPKS